MIIRFLLLLMATVTLVLSHHAMAQDESESGTTDDVEALYDKSEDQAPKPEVKQPVKDDKPAPPAKTLSDLANLAEFSDVAVIQRKFLPKSERFETTITGLTNLNNPFFTNIGFGLGFSYYLTEKWGVEGLFNYVATSKRQVTNDLESNRGINTDSLVTSKAFLGGALKWNPIYGKMTWLNKRIVPFDLNFSAGMGLTRTSEDENEPTVHLGTSQVFAMSKSMAVRWDITWHFFNAKTTTIGGTQDNVFQNDLFIGLGVSFYFPEATYR